MAPLDHPQLDGSTPLLLHVLARSKEVVMPERSLLIPPSVHKLGGVLRKRALDPSNRSRQL
jgi:hypothetical protein